MKYYHAVKSNGIFYPAGVEIPAVDEAKINKEAKVEPKKTTKK